MTNGPAPVTGMEYGGLDATTGLTYPTVGMIPGRLFGVYGSAARSLTGARVLAAALQELEETGNVPTTINAAATSTTANTGILPANSLILLITWRVTVTIPTATAWSLGSAGQPTRFGTGLSVTAGVSGVCIDQWNPANAAGADARQTAAAGLLITPNATPGNGNGRIAFEVVAFTGYPPTA